MHKSKTEKNRTVSEMAKFMIENEGNCTRDTLLLHFTQEQVDAYSADAREEANRQFKQAA